MMMTMIQSQMIQVTSLMSFLIHNLTPYPKSINDIQSKEVQIHKEHNYNNNNK